MYRTYQEQHYSRGNRPEAMAARQEAQAIAIALPRRRSATARFFSNLLALSLLIIISLIILSLVLILLGL